MNVINFMGQRKLAMGFSAIVLLIAIGSLATRQLNWGLDFTGGTLIEVGYDKPAELDAIRAKLDNAGFDDAIVQNFGRSEDVLIRFAPREGKKASELSNDIMRVLEGFVKKMG